MNNIFIKNAKELITYSGEDEFKVIENGALLIREGKIERVGKIGDIIPHINISEQDYRVIDARGKTVMPGFVDPHTHFVFGGYRADEFNWRLQGVSYEEIMDRGGGINNTVKSTRRASFDRLVERGRKRLDSMLDNGVTTVEGKSGYGLDVKNELKQLRVIKELNREHPLDIVPTFLGAHAFPPEYAEAREDYVELILKEMIPEVVAEDLARFIDVFCDRGVFSVEQSRKILQAGQELGLGAKIHADEIARTGGAELAAEIGAVSAEHLLKASPEGIEKMADAGVIAVLLPMTAFSLREEYAPARRIIEAGLSVAVATDFNPGSCYSESIPLLIALSTLYMGLTPAETVKALTINAARALELEDKIGTLEPGKQADVVILDAPSYRHLSYHFGVNLVEMVIKKGEVVKE